MNIGQAVEALKQGKHVARSGWNGKKMWLRLVRPGDRGGPFLGAESLFPQLPYVEMKTADDKLVPWLCSQTDLLAEDWEVVV